MTPTLDTCPYDHPLGPGRILVGWAPCQCGPALRAGHGRGHRTTQCRACSDEHRTTVRYEPYHVGPGHQPAS